MSETFTLSFMTSEINRDDSDGDFFVSTLFSVLFEEFI